jgi:hypothetical protein
MINQEIIKTLEIIYQELEKKGINWVLIGSLSLALQKIDITPKDIDILTDKEGTSKIKNLFKSYKIKPIKFSSSEFFQSYLGEFKINNIKVEVMGELKEKINNKWTSFSDRLKFRRFINIRSMKIPVSDLKKQLKSYKKSKREKDLITAQKIREFLCN